LISDQNPASSKVAVRCGYQRDAILRFLYLKEGVR
jgi:RimJ/RimL family protein N-acetyltransferase